MASLKVIRTLTYRGAGGAVAHINADTILGVGINDGKKHNHAGRTILYLKNGSKRYSSEDTEHLKKILGLIEEEENE